MLNLNKIKKSSLTFALWLAAVIVVLDQASKMLVIKTITFASTHPVIPGLDLTLRYNKGAAFSFLADANGWQRWFFTGLGMIASLCIVFWLSQLTPKKKLETTGLAFILGGAIGNLIDRLRLGSVIDFILFHYQQWEWPAFNIADTAISVGVVLLIAGMFQQE